MKRHMWTLAEEEWELLEAESRTRHRRVLGAIERRMARRLRVAFRRQGALFVRAFVAGQRLRTTGLTEVGEDEWLPAFTNAADATDALFKTAAEEAIAGAMVAGGEMVSADLGLELAFDLAHPRAVAYIERRIPELGAQLNDTTVARIRGVLTQATENGWSYQRTATHLRQLYSGFATPANMRHIRDRAELIAATEVGNAYEYGNATVIRDMETTGAEFEKRWLTVGDNRVDLPHCRANESQDWIPAADQFQSGHDQPLAHQGCRCTALYRLKGTGG